MTENVSSASIGNPSFNDREWRNFNNVHVAANAIGACVCIFYFYHFEPAGDIPSLYDAFVIPVIVAVSFILIVMLYQYRWEKNLIEFIHIIRQGMCLRSCKKNSNVRF